MQGIYTAARCATTAPSSAGATLPKAGSIYHPHLLAAVMVRVAVGSGHACGLVADGSVLCWGRGVESEPCDDEARQCGQAAPPEAKLTQITAGADHTCGIRADGFTICWGRDQAGQATTPVELPE